MQKKFLQFFIAATGIAMLINILYTQNYDWGFWKFNMICALVIFSLLLSLKETEKQE